jgi:ribosomal-protein-alanine N-acetyltransferase
MMKTRLRPMVEADIAQVLEIERESFPSSWPQTAYKRELTNKIARYCVLGEAGEDVSSSADATTGGIWSAFRRAVRAQEPPAKSERLLGFIGMWLMVNEAHIVTVAVREECRRMGIGERLLIAAIDIAMNADQEVVTLEVRASNTGAQRMYEKYGFERAGLRKRYYSDDHEDAVIMTTPDLFSAAYRRELEGLREAHRREHPDLWAT